ncbi:Pol, partial [Symbiodinium microadriaticum]
MPLDKTGLDEAARCHNEMAQQLRDAVAERVEQSAASSPTHLWQLRQQARYTAVQAKRTGRMFAAWRAAIRYHLEAKKAKKACQAKKRQEILDLLQITEDAAQQGDQRKVYQIVKKLAPWAPRNRVILKDDNGKLTTCKQQEKHECLVSYSKALFAPHTEQPHREQEVLPLVFTLEEVQHELCITQVGKAVPPGVAPAAAWRISADLVAPLLQKAFEQHAVANAVLPEKRTDAWIVWLPKPGKAPSNPAALRPIGLMSPEAKTLAAIIRNRLFQHIRPQLTWVPQFAYLPQRDITDALARVHSWMRKYERTIAKAAPGRLALRAR